MTQLLWIICVVLAALLHINLADDNTVIADIQRNIKAQGDAILPVISSKIPVFVNLVNSFDLQDFSRAPFEDLLRIVTSVKPSATEAIEIVLNNLLNADNSVKTIVLDSSLSLNHIVDTLDKLLGNVVSFADSSVLVFVHNLEVIQQ